MRHAHTRGWVLGGISLAALAACSSWNNHPASQQSNAQPAATPYSGTQPASNQYASAAPTPATTPAAPPARHELTSRMVQQVQASLQQQGLYRGSIDGLWGPATEASLKSYQQSHGLNASGEVDSPTLATLSLPSDGTIPAGQSSQQNAPAQENSSPPKSDNSPSSNNPPQSDQPANTPPQDNPPESNPPQQQDSSSPPPQPQ